MKQYTNTYVLKLSEKQAKTLKTLKEKYKVNPAHFIREAISEKLKREKLELKEVIKEKQPF